MQASLRLAYYKAQDGPGALGPRGWSCFATYGSNGSTLYIVPQPFVPSTLFSSSWKGFTGPAIQLSALSGDTSGRFAVAETIARLFPSHRQFVLNVIAEGMQPATTFPFGPYPTDKLTYKSKTIAEYGTPPATEGMGTQSRLAKNDSPIRGVAILEESTPDLVQLTLRLPGALAGLTPLIMQQVERDVTRSLAPDPPAGSRK